MAVGLCAGYRHYVGRLAVTLLFVPLFLVLFNVSPAEAIPAWARKYSVACTMCHTAWPHLNEFGRDFKMNGFRMSEAATPTNQLIDDFLSLDQSFPVTARFIMRPFDKRKNRSAAIRSFHEMELMIAGRVGKHVSAWVEAEAEDEEEFNLFIESGVMGIHPAPEANITMGWAPPFWADPFDTLADGGRRMTRSHKGPLDRAFTARERLRSASQFVGFYGRAGEGRVFYLGGVSSGGSDPEGGDARDGFGKVMVRAARGVYVGGFILGGTNETQAVDLDFRRAGFEFQIEQGHLNVYGLVMNATDDLLAGGDTSETAGYVEALYTIPLQRFPMIVPLARVDTRKDYTDLTLQLNFYLLHNLKTYAEWWQNVDTPGGAAKDNRFTVQLDFAF